MDRNTRLIDLTVGELEDLLAKRVKSETVKESKQYAYGLGGLAETLGCSKRKAIEIKNSGLLDGAVGQSGRKIIVDVEKAREIFIKSTIF